MRFVEFFGRCTQRPYCWVLTVVTDSPPETGASTPQGGRGWIVYVFVYVFVFVFVFVIVIIIVLVFFVLGEP